MKKKLEETFKSQKRRIAEWLYPKSGTPERRAILATTYSFLPVYVFFSFLLPINLPNVAVIELEKALLQIDGVLLGFSAVTYAYLLSGIEARITVYIRMQSQQLELERARTRSVRLTKGAVAVFIAFILSLMSSVGYLTGALIQTNSVTLYANALIFPLFLMVMGLVVILVNMTGLIEEQQRA